MQYKGVYYAVVPSELPVDHLATSTKSLMCPFCSSQLEPIQCEVCNETCKVDKWERGNMVHSTMATKTPIALKCKECGIEIHNLSLLGWFYGEQVKD